METQQTEQTAPEIIVNSRSIEILDPNLDNITKIGRMARLCYRSMVKEGEDEKAAGERIIKHCLSGDHPHLSILEHASYTLYLPTDMTNDNKHMLELINGHKGQMVKPFRYVWDLDQTSFSKKYAVSCYDPSLYKFKPGAAEIQGYLQNKQLLPGIAADASAWRHILNESLVQASQVMDDPVRLLLVFRVIQAFKDIAPVIFGDIYDNINDGLAKQLEQVSLDPNSITSRCYDLAISKVPADQRTVDGIVRYFFTQPDEIYVGESDPSFTFSFIATTDRSVTHQLVRHRSDVAYSQESQRYVNYDKKGYAFMHLTVDPGRQLPTDSPIKDQIDPVTGELKEDSEAFKLWKEAMTSAASYYNKLVALGVPTESARSVLPNGTQTRIGVTWFMPGSYSNFLFYRLEKHAQYDIRRMAAEGIVNGCITNHPFFEMVAPEHIIENMGLIQDQHLLGDDKIETIKTIVDKQKERLNKIREYIKAEQERAAKEAEAIAEARKKQEEEAAKQIKEAPEIVTKEEQAKKDVEHPDGGENVIPAGAKVIRVHSATAAEAPEPVTQRPPTIDFIKPKSEAPVEPAPEPAAPSEPEQPNA